MTDEVALGDLEGASTVDEGDVRARATDVERDQHPLLDGPSDGDGALHSGRRPGEQRVNGPTADDYRREGHQTAVGLHQEQAIELETARTERFGQIPDVVDEQRLEAGVEQHRRDPGPLQRIRGAPRSRSIPEPPGTARGRPNGSAPHGSDW